MNEAVDAQKCRMSDNEVTSIIIIIITIITFFHIFPYYYMSLYVIICHDIRRASVYINAVYSDDWDDPMMVMMVMMVVMLTVMNVGHLNKDLLHTEAFTQRSFYTENDDVCPKEGLKSSLGP